MVIMALIRLSNGHKVHVLEVLIANSYLVGAVKQAQSSRAPLDVVIVIALMGINYVWG